VSDGRVMRVGCWRTAAVYWLTIHSGLITNERTAGIWAQTLLLLLRRRWPRQQTGSRRRGTPRFPALLIVWGCSSVREGDRDAGAAEVDHRDQGVGGVESVRAVADQPDLAVEGFEASVA